VLRATAGSWVEVRQKGGRVLLRRTMKAGETWTVPAEPDLLLDSGNAGALMLEVNGVPTKLPGVKPGVVRNVPLDTGLR
jgi:cytoskeleton protein RodZ